MKTLEQLLDIIEEAEISIDKYIEKGKLCGYELNAYTQAGVNEILFLDFRDPGKDPNNPKDFIAEFESYINHYTVDDRVENNRKDPMYRQDFTLNESLIDFNKFQNKLNDILSEMKGINTYCIESRVERIECTYITAKNRKEAIKIAEQNQSLNWVTVKEEERKLTSIA